jgi:AraC-like DNA-binding protein
MDEARDIFLDRGWLIMVSDLGIEPEDVIRRAGLPLEMLHQETSRLTVNEYFAMLAAVEELADDPLLPIKIGQAASPEAFSPPMFAALCSSTLAVAVQRIAAHKRLIAPLHVLSQETSEGLTVSWAWDDPTIRSPRLLMAIDLVFLTRLARIATREFVQPVRVTCPVELEPAEAYRDFFGIEPVVGPELSLTFSSADAHRPFLTASDALWASFEPELQRRTSKLEAQKSMADRTGSMLLECLPSGEATLQQTARRLGVSTRTLQRRLTEEGVTFRTVVQATRERLAQHYLSNTALPHREISFLLGYDEPSSFFRAFHDWSGETPESFRVAAR